MENTLTYQEALEIYRAVLAGADHTDPDIMDLYNDMYKRATRYAHIRATWNTLTRKEKMETDGSRTASHDAFIASINIVARLQGEHGSTWRTRLSSDRKRIGDFACYLSLFQSLDAR